MNNAAYVHHPSMNSLPPMFDASNDDGPVPCRTRSLLKHGLQALGAQFQGGKHATTSSQRIPRVPGFWVQRCILRPLWSKPETFGLTSWPEASATGVYGLDGLTLGTSSQPGTDLFSFGVPREGRSPWTLGCGDRLLDRRQVRISD